ncbi:MAG: hypothetical protein WAO35_07580 [Terriglobia bacterium]
MDHSLQAQTVIGAGRGTLITGIAGAGWLAWGLSEARAFNGIVGPALGFTELFLLVGSIYVIRQGRRLRQQYGPVPASMRRATLKPFLLVLLVEVLAISLVLVLAYRLRRADLGADWCALVVGLHYLPLAKIFRAPILGVLGTLITLWCLLAWALFRPHALLISAAMGTGILLLAACVAGLLRARKIIHSLP